MRGVIVLLSAGLALAGCSRTGEIAATNATPAAATTPAASASNFSPPTSTSRAVYGGRMERRFRKLDKDQDSKLAAADFPKNRGARMVKRLDKNGDGSIDATEWSEGMLARFDKQDVNNDGNLTSDEGGKKKSGGKRGGKRERQGGIDDETDEVDNEM